jgi:hypothetical protein
MAKLNSNTTTVRMVMTHNAMMRATPLEFGNSEFGTLDFNLI